MINFTEFKQILKESQTAEREEEIKNLMLPIYQGISDEELLVNGINCLDHMDTPVELGKFILMIALTHFFLGMKHGQKIAEQEILEGIYDKT